MHPFIGSGLYAALALAGILLPRDSADEVTVALIWAGFTVVLVPFYVFALAPKLRKTLYLRVKATLHGWSYQRPPWKWRYLFGSRKDGVETRVQGTFRGHPFTFEEYATYKINSNQSLVRGQTNWLTIPLPPDKGTHQFSAKYHWWERIKKSDIDGVREAVDDDVARWLASRWGFTVLATAGCISTIEERGINPMRIRRQLRFLIAVIDRLPAGTGHTRTGARTVRHDQLPARQDQGDTPTIDPYARRS